MGKKSVPAQPDPNKAALAGMVQNAINLPYESRIDAMAQMGSGQFQGLGTADVNNAINNQLAPAMLALAQKYGPDYVKQRLADLAQSDPTGTAARQQLFNRIQADAGKVNQSQPMANDTQSLVEKLLGQGSKLTEGPGSETEQVQQGVRGQQLKNGIFLGNAPESQEASAVVNAGDAQQQQRQSQALQFLQSGVSPEDVTYRKVQQSLSNLGNAIQGQTPEANFGSLSGAQQGAAPFQGGNPYTPMTNPNAGINGFQNASQIYSGNLNWSSQQANPWTAGLSTAANTVSGLNNMGFFGSGAAGPAYGSIYAGAGGANYMSTPTASGGGMSVPVG